MTKATQIDVCEGKGRLVLCRYDFQRYQIGLVQGNEMLKSNYKYIDYEASPVTPGMWKRHILNACTREERAGLAQGNNNCKRKKKKE